MTTMRERLARRLYSERGYEDDDPWKAATERRVQLEMGEFSRKQIDCFRDVDAILDELREPTDDMGNGLPADYRPGNYSATQIWQAMIDRAKEGG